MPDPSGNIAPDQVGDKKSGTVEEREDGSAGRVESQGGEGARNAEATPKIGTEGEQGQTAVPAPEDDVGGGGGQSRTD